nr:CaiF/GrlA family transcriptional regulator [Serratia marcescens]
MLIFLSNFLPIFFDLFYIALFSRVLALCAREWLSVLPCVVIYYMSIERCSVTYYLEGLNMVKINNESRRDELAAPSGVAKKKVAGKQRNHGDFCLPDTLAHLMDPPLYLAVAHWGMATGLPLSRALVSETFRISERRAADVLNYIARDRHDVIDCQRHIVREGAGRRGLKLTITAIRGAAPRAASPPPARGSTARSRAASRVQQLRHWFLSRPNLSSAE